MSKANSAKPKGSGRGLIYLIMAVASGFFLWSSFQDIKTHVIMQLTIQESQATQQEVNEQREELEQTKRNLTNPDYIEKYVRGHYLVTREGEQVFKFPAMDKSNATVHKQQE